MAPNLRLGINTCFAVKRWPEPERWLSMVTDRLGLEDVQLSLDLFDPGLDPTATLDPAAEIRRRAEESGVRLHSTFTGLSAYSANLLLHPEPAARRGAEEWFERAIELTARLGAAGTGGFLGALSVADAADEARRRQLTEELGATMGRLSGHATEHGLEFLLFENMAVPRELGHSIDEALELEAAGDGGGDTTAWVLCLDLGHPCALRTGEPDDDPLAWIAADWRRVPVVQVQQANREGDHHWPFTEQHNAAGLLDPAAAVSALRSWRTDGDVHLFLEVIHPPECPDDLVLAELEVSVDHWRRCLDQD